MSALRAVFKLDMASSASGRQLAFVFLRGEDNVHRRKSFLIAMPSRTAIIVSYIFHSAARDNTTLASEIDLYHFAPVMVREMILFLSPMRNLLAMINTTISYSSLLLTTPACHRLATDRCMPPCRRGRIIDHILAWRRQKAANHEHIIAQFYFIDAHSVTNAWYFNVR